MSRLGFLLYFLILKYNKDLLVIRKHNNILLYVVECSNLKSKYKVFFVLFVLETGGRVRALESNICVYQR